MKRHPSGLTPKINFTGTFPIGSQEIPPPGDECVYALYDGSMACVYVGRSRVVRERLTKHWHTPAKKPHLYSWQVWTFDDDAAGAAHFEAELIQSLDPDLNRKFEYRVRR